MIQISFNLIYCRSLNNAIGLDNGLPWKIKGDLKRFKELTTDGLVVMGRKTWDSFPKRPLPDRINVVLTGGSSLCAPINSVTEEDSRNVYFANSPGRVLEIARQYSDKKMWLIGGVSVYKQFAGLVTTVYETVVMSNQVVGDTYYKFEGRTRLIREDDRMSCSVNGETVDVVNRVLEVL